MSHLTPPSPFAPYNLLPSKIVIVTGASRGIGRACALESARQGAHVVVHYLGDTETEREALELKGEIEALGMRRRAVLVPGDIRFAETAEKLVDVSVKEFGRIDVLISNAGICPFHSFLDMPHSLWKRVQDVNLNGAFYAVQAVANQMAKQEPKGGSIVAVSSISALVGGAHQTHYTPTKAGIKSLIESVAVALGPFGIRANCVLPGTVETSINADDLSDPTKRAYMEQRTPLGRLGRPEDIAGPAMFLASDLARFVSGASLLADGGMFVNLQ